MVVAPSLLHLEHIWRGTREGGHGYHSQVRDVFSSAHLPDLLQYLGVLQFRNCAFFMYVGEMGMTMHKMRTVTRLPDGDYPYDELSQRNGS